MLLRTSGVSTRRSLWTFALVEWCGHQVSRKAFEKLLGPDRYRWMKSLGNKAIEDDTLDSMQIAEPKAVKDLLDLAVHETNENNRRLIFFCG
jgi:hypothetical protein